MCGSLVQGSNESDLEGHTLSYIKQHEDKNEVKAGSVKVAEEQASENIVGTWVPVDTLDLG
jgi:hypothetical protein